MKMPLLAALLSLLVSGCATTTIARPGGALIPDARSVSLGSSFIAGVGIFPLQTVTFYTGVGCLLCPSIRFSITAFLFN
jgi:hypothetical protein